MAKKRRWLLFVFITLLALLFGLTIFPAQASVVGSFDIRENIWGHDQIYLTVIIGEYVDYEPDFMINEVVFLDLKLSTDDVGQTYSVSSGTEFNEAVAYLTNDINDFIEYDVFYPSGGGFGCAAMEARFFFGDETGANGIDFAGYNINRISLTVNSWTDPVFNFNASLKVHAVPIPAAVWLLVSSLIGLAGFRRKFRKRLKSD